MAQPICFMIMPFATKETGLGADANGPTQVDFDALWEKALAPAIEDSGYTPVRADQDAGALIIVEMIQRLAMSDLVVADISIGNANVYYEIGVRHAAKQHGCVLLSAEWAHVLFDINQMPRVVYSMAEGAITDSTAATIRQQVREGIEGLKEGESPVYQAVPGFPASLGDADRIAAFKADMGAINELLGRVRAVRRVVGETDRRAACLALRDELASQAAIQDGISIEMMELIRDCAGWDEMIAWIDAMPDRLRERPSILEQRLLAVSKTGDPRQAIGALEQLIETAGDTSERQGLLGGRYKKLWLAETDDGKRQTYLDRAIDHYERGMMLDLNDYYPTCNLPRLYRERAQPGDEDRARLAGPIALMACERASALDADDGWLRPTLLGAAFDARDVAKAAELAQQVRRDHPATWKLDTTMADLRVSVEQAEPAVAAQLAPIYDALNELLPEDARQAPVAAPRAADDSGNGAGTAAKAKKVKKPKAKAKSAKTKKSGGKKKRKNS